MTIIPPAPPRPPNEWGTLSPRHFRNEMAKRNMGPFTYSNLQTQGLNADLRARANALEAMKKLGITPSGEAIAAKPGTATRAAGNGGGGGGSGPVSPSSQAAGRTGPAGPRGWNQNPAQPVRAPRPTVATPGTRPGQGPIGGGAAGLVGSYVLGQALAPVERIGGGAAQAVGRGLGTITGIKDTPEEFAAKPGFYKRWACFNAWSAGVNDPRCQEVPPPQTTSEVAGNSLVTYGDPSFTGGQKNTPYVVSITTNDDGYSETYSLLAHGPIGGTRVIYEAGAWRVQIYCNGTGSSFNSTCAPIPNWSPGWYTAYTGFGTNPNKSVSASIGSVSICQGVDDGGNIQGPEITLPAERPQRSAPPPPSGPFNPESLPQTAPQRRAAPAAPPASDPALDPSNPAPSRPPDRKAAPIPTPTPQPPIAPDGSPTGNPAPDATPTNVPAGGTAVLPNGTTATRTPTGYEVSVPLGDPRSLVSPRPVTTPDGDVISPGESIEEEKKAGGLPWWLAAPPVVAKIPSGSKVNATDPSSFVDPEPPKTPPPSQPPTDNACRCNAPIVNRLDSLDDKLTRALGGVSAAGDAGILTYLLKMQAFAEKAWEKSRIQKVINALTLITVLHNASMVSRDAGETLGYALGQGLDVLGIEDEEGNTLDVNGWFGTQANNFFENLFGAERWHGLNETWNKANRIISSASNIIWTIRSLHDGTQEVLEWTAENLGKIGNGLKKWGVVGQRAYPWMAERVKAQDMWRQKTSRLMDGLESVENIASSYATVISEVKEMQDEAGELVQQVNDFAELVGYEPGRKNSPTAEENVGIISANEEAALNAVSGPAVTATDMEPSTNGTP